MLKKKQVGFVLVVIDWYLLPLRLKGGFVRFEILPDPTYHVHHFVVREELPSRAINLRETRLISRREI